MSNDTNNRFLVTGLLDGRCLGLGSGRISYGLRVKYIFHLQYHTKIS